jgi:hypothetical protein
MLQVGATGIKIREDIVIINSQAQLGHHHVCTNPYYFLLSKLLLFVEN